MIFYGRPVGTGQSSTVKIGSKPLPLFDAYLFIDWSAANRVKPQQPTADAVWIGELVRLHCLHCQNETYHRTRSDGIEDLTSRLLDHVMKDRRVPVGFDFPYGYPSGFRHALGLPPSQHEWWEVWTELTGRVHDDANNINNRFYVAAELNAIIANGRSGPFWGHPRGKQIANLETTSPAFPFNGSAGVCLKRRRLAEERLPRTQETWKLYGAGSVGSQALVGIPRVYRLRRHPKLVGFSRVWTFETGFSSAPSLDRGPFILHAEIWPGVVRNAANVLLTDKSLIPDQAQVRAMCQWVMETDDNGQLGELFAQPIRLNQ